MTQRIIRWLTEPCPFWEFWRPTSGLLGGLMMGAVVNLVYMLIVKLGR